MTKKTCKNCKFWKVDRESEQKTTVFEDGLIHQSGPLYGYCVETSKHVKELVNEDFCCPSWQGTFLFD